MIVENRSNRTSLISKAYNCVPSTFSFLYQSERRKAYNQRLYFEYLFTEKVKGSTFFYTLTYNDKSIPWYSVHFEDKVEDVRLFRCFDYQHIQWLTHSVLDTVLHRKFGSRLRYFCACETGEGKGKRGLGSNPHYHMIFFVQPIIKDGVPQYDNYKRISPVLFRSLVRDAWQGTHKYVKFEEAKFGIAKEGDMLGLVQSPAAFKYVSKYVLKDNVQKAWERIVFDYWTDYIDKRGADNKALWMYYKYWSSSCFDSTQSALPPHHFFYYLGLDKYNRWRHFTNDPDKSYYRYITRYCDNLDIKVAATEFNTWFTERYKPLEVLYQVRQFNNRYSGKTRCSKSLGEYGLKFVLDPDFEPSFSIPNADSYDVQRISLYYYRKLYYETYTCDVTGNVLYRLNSRGVNLHLNHLDATCRKIKQRVKENISLVRNEQIKQFEYLRKDKFMDLIEDDEFLNKYALYTAVYKYRAFDTTDFSKDILSFNNAREQYVLFLLSDAFLFDWDYQTIFIKRKNNPNFIDYSKHEEIKPFIDRFDFIDRLCDHANDYRSECSKSRFNEVADLRKRHSITQYNSLST